MTYASINTRFVEAYANRVLGELVPGTYNHYLSLVQAFLLWASQEAPRHLFVPLPAVRATPSRHHPPAGTVSHRP